MTRLTMDLPALNEARQNLVTARLIAYEKPLYQVLSLEPLVERPDRVPLHQPVAIAQIFRQMMGGAK
ncbi:hypothetical protein [Desulfoferrobacter suflitae]|uniref:hypothetical protein n=1 Tax=Desulfoferrobacter suflitae TaxID=2865782 RepID=UPI002164C8DD|nr:hypothetical protein [Desulfoferrobacter suflitae]MCK8603181.1 hypothetical protein [Desulfoferrobacter suflitae]